MLIFRWGNSVSIDPLGKMTPNVCGEGKELNPLWVLFLLVHRPCHAGGWFQALKCTTEINTFIFMASVINTVSMSAHLWVIPLLGDISPEWRGAEGIDSRFGPKTLREKWIYGSEELESTKMWSGGSLNTVQSVPKQGWTEQDQCHINLGAEIFVTCSNCLCPV